MDHILDVPRAYVVLEGNASWLQNGELVDAPINADGSVSFGEAVALWPNDCVSARKIEALTLAVRLLELSDSIE